MYLILKRITIPPSLLFCLLVNPTNLTPFQLYCFPFPFFLADKPASHNLERSALARKRFTLQGLSNRRTPPKGNVTLWHLVLPVRPCSPSNIHLSAFTLLVSVLFIHKSFPILSHFFLCTHLIWLHKSAEVQCSDFIRTRTFRLAVYYQILCQTYALILDSKILFIYDHIRCLRMLI